MEMKHNTDKHRQGAVKVTGLEKTRNSPLNFKMLALKIEFLEETFQVFENNTCANESENLCHIVQNNQYSNSLYVIGTPVAIQPLKCLSGYSTSLWLHV